MKTVECKQCGRKLEDNGLPPFCDSICQGVYLPPKPMGQAVKTAVKKGDNKVPTMTDHDAATESLKDQYLQNVSASNFLTYITVKLQLGQELNSAEESFRQDYMKKVYAAMNA